MRCLKPGLLAVALLCALPAGAAERVPVMIGGDATLDPCSNTNIVGRLNPNGDNFLALRAGPGTKYPMLEKCRAVSGSGYVTAGDTGSGSFTQDPALIAACPARCAAKRPIAAHASQAGSTAAFWAIPQANETILPRACRPDWTRLLHFRKCVFERFDDFLGQVGIETGQSGRLGDVTFIG